MKNKRPSIVRMLFFSVAIGSAFTAFCVVWDHFHPEDRTERLTVVQHKEVGHVR